MATLEDKILNGPTAHYCDAEADDIRHDEIEHGDDSPDHSGAIESGVRQLSIRDNITDRSPIASGAQWSGVSKNTGPKGVLHDHRNPTRGDKDSDLIDKEINELLDGEDHFFQQYMRNRIAQMKRDTNCIPDFGDLYHISSGDEFLGAVDRELPTVLVIVHVYVKFSKPCKAMNKCLSVLAKQYRQIKFATLDASVAGMSEYFKDNGVPALLAYKNGELVKSLVRLTEELDNDFETEQVRELLEANNLI